MSESGDNFLPKGAFIVSLLRQQAFDFGHVYLERLDDVLHPCADRCVDEPVRSHDLVVDHLSCESGTRQNLFRRVMPRSHDVLNLRLPLFDLQKLTRVRSNDLFGLDLARCRTKNPPLTDDSEYPRLQVSVPHAVRDVEKNKPCDGRPKTDETTWQQICQEEEVVHG